MKAVIIAGSRTFDDYDLMEKYCNLMLEDWNPLAIICGMARGADLLGRRWAISKGIPVLEMPADWKSSPRRAGFIRNEAMRDIADAALVFWNGHSSGSAHMIRIMREAGKSVVVVNF